MACAAKQAMCDPLVSDVSYDAKNSSRITRDSMYQYYVACYQEVGHAKRFHWSLDGLRVGGEETIPVITYCPEVKKLCYAAPQDWAWKKKCTEKTLTM